MTKTVRIENADNAKYEVIVEVWDKGIDGAPDILSSSTVLKNPTEMAAPYITSSRYLIVKENGNG